MTDLRRCAWTAAAGVGLSWSGHVLGGGSPPSPVATLLVAVLGMVFAALLTNARRPLPPATLTVLLGAFQMLAHGVFHVVAGPGRVVLDAQAHHGVHVGHAAGVSAAGVSEAAVAQTATAATHLSAHPAAHAAADVATHTHAMGLSPLMLTSHLLVTVVLAWALGPGLRQVRELVRRATPVTPVLRPLPLRPPSFVLPPVTRSRDVVAAVGLRGPPAYQLAA